MTKSLSARRAWIEMSPLMWPWSPLKSLSARRAWIEIEAPTKQAGKHVVALRKESVDRNLIGQHLINSRFVALRKESVDRNL